MSRYSIIQKSTVLTIALSLSAIGSAIVPAAAYPFGMGGSQSHYLGNHAPSAGGGSPSGRWTPSASSNWGGYGGNGGAIKVPSSPGTVSNTRPGPGPGGWPAGGSQASNGAGSKPMPDKDCGISGRLCGGSQSGNYPSGSGSQSGNYPSGGAQSGGYPSGGNYPSGGGYRPNWPNRYPPVIVEERQPVVYVRPQPVVVAAPAAPVAPVVAAPVVAAPVAAAAPAASAPCNCLTKEYQNDGSVVFHDLCTREAAIATQADLQAQRASLQTQAPAR